jgi:hypothetical protein
MRIGSLMGNPKFLAIRESLSRKSFFSPIICALLPQESSQEEKSLVNWVPAF